MQDFSAHNIIQAMYNRSDINICPTQEKGEKRPSLLASFPALLLGWGGAAVVGVLGEATLLVPLLPKASVKALMAVHACKNCKQDHKDHI